MSFDKKDLEDYVKPEDLKDTRAYFSIILSLEKLCLFRYNEPEFREFYEAMQPVKKILREELREQRERERTVEETTNTSVSKPRNSTIDHMDTQ